MPSLSKHVPRDTPFDRLRANGRVAGEAEWRAQGDDVRFMNDVAPRLG